MPVAFDRIALALALLAAAGCQPPLPPHVDDAKITISAPLGMEEMRAALIAYVWKEQGFPTRLPDAIELEVETPIAQAAHLAAQVDRYTIRMEEGFVSHAYHFHPLKAQRRLVVFHQGHAEQLGDDGGADAISYLLGEGYDVLALEMPCYGENDDPLPDHDQVMLLDGAARPYSPLKFFLEPVAVALNAALAESRWHAVSMVGISGGGWTTTVYAAIDPRIHQSFPVAGTLPLYLRVNERDYGDAEQYFPDFYSIAGYPDLYLMGAAGQDRMQIQVLNQFDPCCFEPPDDRRYVKQVKAHLRRLGLDGLFHLVVDEGQSEHTISPWTLRQVVTPAIDRSVRAATLRVLAHPAPVATRPSVAAETDEELVGVFTPASREMPE